MRTDTESSPTVMKDSEGGRNKTDESTRYQDSKRIGNREAQAGVTSRVYHCSRLRAVATLVIPACEACAQCFDANRKRILALRGTPVIGVNYSCSLATAIFAELSRWVGGYRYRGGVARLCAA